MWQLPPHLRRLTRSRACTQTAESHLVRQRKSACERAISASAGSGLDSDTKEILEQTSEQLRLNQREQYVVVEQINELLENLRYEAADLTDSE
jgi:hypothetical protein